MPSLGLFSFGFFVCLLFLFCSNSSVLVFVLSYFFYYYSLEASLFSNEGQKGGGCGREGEVGRDSEEEREEKL